MASCIGHTLVTHFHLTLVSCVRCYSTYFGRAMCVVWVQVEGGAAVHHHPHCGQGGSHGGSRHCLWGQPHGITAFRLASGTRCARVGYRTKESNLAK